MNLSTDGIVKAIDECYLEAARHCLDCSYDMTVSCCGGAGSPVYCKTREADELIILTGGEHGGRTRVHCMIHSGCADAMFVISLRTDCSADTFMRVCSSRGRLFGFSITRAENEDDLVSLFSEGCRAALLGDDTVFVAARDADSAVQLALAVRYIAKIGSAADKLR